MLTDTFRWSHAPVNEVVPSRWQATPRNGDPSKAVTWPLATIQPADGCPGQATTR